MPRDLAADYQLTPEQILQVIARSPRCEQMVKGFVAEYHFELKLIELKEQGLIDDWEKIDQDGQPDYRVTIGGRTQTIEVKLFMTQAASNGRYKVDFQRTRNSPGDPLSRFYRRSDFDVLAGCTYNQNHRWDFVCIRTSDLPLDDKVGQDCLKKAVYYLDGDPGWTSDIIEVLGIRAERGEHSIRTTSLDRFS